MPGYTSRIPTGLTCRSSLRGDRRERSPRYLKTAAVLRACPGSAASLRPCGHRLSDNVGCRQARSQQSGAQLQWEAFMARRNVSCHAALLAGSILALPAMAADVTPDRLANAGRTPLSVPLLHPIRRNILDPASKIVE